MNAITSVPASQSQQSHAGTAAATLRSAIVTAAHAPLRDAVQAYRTAWAALTPDADLLDVLRAAGGIVLAAEAIVAASKQVETTARTALAQAMSETGCRSVGLASHVVHLSTFLRWFLACSIRVVQQQFSGLYGPSLSMRSCHVSP